MKKTLLALMLVSSLFVISCGADSTKPSDAYKSQKVEIASGTKTATITGASGNTVDVSSFATAGEKVTEIIEVTDNSSTPEKPTTIKTNPDGGIYEFTTTTVASPTSVTYKYTRTAIAPVTTKTISESATAGSITITASTTDTSKLLYVSLVTDLNGKNMEFSYSGTTITLADSTFNGKVNVTYQYMDMSIISEKPTKEGTIEVGSAITLTAATDSGKSYVCKVYQNPITPEYFYGIVPATGKITLSGTSEIDNYKLWLY
ncbi:hypothetical protein [uncultured Brachyspira sp.]|uniref:hypothetical protein n=1 Tax=uncultured Brachyspira sp. TaxID=221953 RepID=UPI00260B6162|nr:hypothetical protein [uncultured Brachyspira sp.]